MPADEPGLVRIPARDIPTPVYLSPAAQAMLIPRTMPHFAYPALDDRDGWKAQIAATEQDLLPLLLQIGARDSVKVDEIVVAGVRVYDVLPEGPGIRERGIVLDMHGGGLTLCGGELCKLMATGIAHRLQARVWSVDYRMPPDHPYPAALDDGIAVYRALLEQFSPAEIVVHGSSAGGNLAAALVLRARDEGLPLPAGVVLNTPEIDLTESGDSFHTNLGIDPTLGSLMAANLLYADGAELAHPYLSPLYADFSKGFPPAILTTGTRDLYLSNTVRMHRALRDADIPAELHVVEAAGHGGFAGAPEGEPIARELRRFVRSVWSPEP